IEPAPIALAPVCRPHASVAPTLLAAPLRQPPVGQLKNQKKGATAPRQAWRGAVAPFLSVFLRPVWTTPLACGILEALLLQEEGGLARWRSGGRPSRR